MQALLLKLQADVVGRKHVRAQEVRPGVRTAALLAVVFLAAFEWGARSANANSFLDGSHGWAASAAESARGEVELQRAYIERLERIQNTSSQYGIAADLAASIEDVARAERLDPEIAFGLVRTESEFTQRAVSPVGAVGYTQLMPATARLLAPGIDREALFDRETNLRLGFRFLRSLIVYYEGDVRLALTAYNRGPVLVDRLLAAGQDPDNGYAARVLGR